MQANYQTKKIILHAVCKYLFPKCVQIATQNHCSFFLLLQFLHTICTVGLTPLAKFGALATNHIKVVFIVIVVIPVGEEEIGLPASNRRLLL